jgi:hypothetical protein
MQTDDLFSLTPEMVHVICNALIVAKFNDNDESRLEDYTMLLDLFQQYLDGKTDWVDNLNDFIKGRDGS